MAPAAEQSASSQTGGLRSSTPSAASRPQQPVAGGSAGSNSGIRVLPVASGGVSNKRLPLNAAASVLASLFPQLGSVPQEEWLPVVLEKMMAAKPPGVSDDEAKLLAKALADTMSDRLAQQQRKDRRPR